MLQPNLDFLPSKAAPPPVPLRASLGPLAEGPLGRKGGIVVAQGYGGLDIPRLHGLIEAGFGKKLVDGYFDSPARSVVLQEDYLGAAIIKDLPIIPCPYLDKFAVAPHMQGNGLGKALWQSIKAHNASLLWRAAATNPANGWYERNSDGSARSGEWIVYWYNVDPAAAIEAAAAAAQLPKTIIK